MANLFTKARDLAKARGEVFAPHKHVKFMSRATGIGTVLSSVLHFIGITKSDSCRCKHYAMEMDQKGTQWCIDNISVIVGWLKAEAEIRVLPFHAATVRVMLMSLLRGYQILESSSSRLQAKPYALLNDSWATVVTASQRQTESTLRPCLGSIIAAGWLSPVVFAEPGAEVPGEIDLIRNAERLGCWHNWRRSVLWALSNTKAEYVLTSQDDVIFHPDTRKFVEDHCLPLLSDAAVSLYTGKNQSTHRGNLRNTGINEVNPRTWRGNCAVVWHRDVLQRVVQHPDALKWLGTVPDNVKHKVQYVQMQRVNPHLISEIDVAVGRILSAEGIKLFCVDPSPVQHVSLVSTAHRYSAMVLSNCVRCATTDNNLESQVTTAVNSLESLQ